MAKRRRRSLISERPRTSISPEEPGEGTPAPTAPEEDTELVPAGRPAASLSEAPTELASSADDELAELTTPAGTHEDAAAEDHEDEDEVDEPPVPDEHEDAPESVDSEDADEEHADEEDVADPPPLPGGWPLDANLPHESYAAQPKVPEAPRKPTPDAPPIRATTPSPGPVFARPTAMLKGHSRPPSPLPLLTAREFRLFAIAFGVALSAIACGFGGLLGLGIVLPF